MPRVEALSDPTELRRCMRDLLALSALPSILKSYDPHQIADGVAAALVSMLDSEFVYISLPGKHDDPLIEIARIGKRSAADSLGAIRPALRDTLLAPSSEQVLAVANPIGEGTLRIASAPIGFGNDAVIVVGSRQSDFPTAAQRLLLGIAANEATIALQRWQTETEERVRRTEQELRRVIDSIPALVWSALPDGTVDFINQRWLEYTGLSLAEGHGWGWMAAIHPEDSATFLEAWRSALAAGEFFEREARLRRADGAYRWFLARAAPLRDEIGSIVKWSGTMTDIEDRKQAADELQQTQANLAHVTRVTTLGELMSSIAHEVSQPVAAVVTSAGASLRWLAAQPPNLEKARHALDRIVNDGHRASEIIDRIRALAKKVPPRKDRLDINEIILEVSALTRSELHRNRVALQTLLLNDLPSVSGDRIQLQQVLLNLIVNAIQAMGGVSKGPREVLVGSGKDDSDSVLVAVRDSGPGLDTEQLEHLFDAFYTTKPNGLGMGLAISRSIIEAHGGRLWATPNVPRGAVLQFTLPAYGQEAPSQK